MAGTKVYSIERGLRTLKEGATLADYKTRYPSAITVRMPGLAKLERWSNDGICLTPDGCRVEPDGHCEHNYPAWLLVLGLI